MHEGFYRILCGALVLASGEAHSGGAVIAGPAINGQQLIEVAPLIEAAPPFIRDGVSGTETVTFTVAREHATHADAFAHCAGHFELVRGRKDLVISLLQGAVTTVWTATAAGWQTVGRPAPQGVRTEISYSVVCAGLTITSGEEEGAAEDVALDGGDAFPLGDYDTIDGNEAP